MRSLWILILAAGCSHHAAPAPVDNGGGEAPPPTSNCERPMPDLGFVVCAVPVGEGQVEVSVRHTEDGEILWSDMADRLAQANSVGGGLNLVLAKGEENWVVDLEVQDGDVIEVNRFEDSGD